MSQKRIKRRKPRNMVVNVSLEVPPEDLVAYGKLIGKERPATKAELARLIRAVVGDRLARLRTVALEETDQPAQPEVAEQ